MHVVDVLTRLGGVATAGQLTRATSRRAVSRALECGDIVRNGRGYAAPTADLGRRAAAALSGTMSHRTAAAHHGWELKQPPPRPEVIVPRGRKLPAHRRVDIDVRWRRDPAGLVTSPVDTVIDCARDLPFDEALAIADSALRHGDVTRDELLEAALRLPTTGRRSALRVAEQADGRAANPFESVLRSIALDVAGIRVEPQVTIGTHHYVARPDLVDEVLGIVLEADSHGFHSHRAALKRDCERYNELTLLGWLVLRFSWEHVMFDPDYVRSRIERAVSRRRAERRTTRRIRTASAG